MAQPTTKQVAAAPRNASGYGQPRSRTRIAAAYAPIPMKAPWPSEICPLYPVRMLSPSIATARVPAIASW